MKLFGISDLHLAHRVNRNALRAMPQRPDDWLVIAGDVGEAEAHLTEALRVLCPRFRRVIWVPGNHDLWSKPGAQELRGEAKYLRLVSICRKFGVTTPEDPYPVFRGLGGPCVVVPLFLLYDYSFRPGDVPAERAVAWAQDSGILCADESLLAPEPYPTRTAWCHARCQWTEARLEELRSELPLVLVNHFPLIRGLAATPLVPRFSIWCGTERTEQWHLRFNAKVVVSGHVHIRRTAWRDGVRFEEVSLGYPRQWRQEAGIGAYLREVLPGSSAKAQERDRYWR